jgi:uncharacterized protein CbrC (UPF0167 family)
MAKPAKLPRFKYHPDPVATGAIVASEETCVCCVEPRGYKYAGSVFCEGDEPKAICPWCIADGAAAEEYEATFTNEDPLADLDEEIIDQVARHTPGYESWQENDWKTCCDDACAYHGDAPRAELEALSGEALAPLLYDLSWDADEWTAFVTAYTPGGPLSMHKFICLHCKAARYGYDPS